MAAPESFAKVNPSRTELRFNAVGDTLPMHTHGDADAHITVVTRGSFDLIVAHMVAGSLVAEPTLVVTAGQEIDTPAGVYHAFVARVDGARLLNLTKQQPRA